LTREELRSRVTLLGLAQYRADQVLTWIYSGFASSFDDMTNIAKKDRAILSEAFVISGPTISRTEVSSDGTRKFLFRLEDKHTVESVLIPDEDRQTL
jgi:23S rRNA (adenine2503-C2)-methyltransferase